MDIWNFKFGFIGEFFSGHPERSRNAVESKDLLSHKEILRLRATPSAQDDRLKELAKQQFVYSPNCLAIATMMAHSILLRKRSQPYLYTPLTEPVAW